MKKELLEINEMVKGDEIAEKIMSDLLDVYCGGYMELL